MRWMGSAGRVELYATRGGKYSVTFTVYSFGRVRRLRFHGRNGSHDVWATPVFKKVSVPISLPRGRSSLLLTAQPGPERLPDGRLATVYISNWRIKQVSASERKGGRLAPLPAELP